MKFTARLDGETREFVLERHEGRLTARCGDVEHVLDLALVGDGAAFSLLIDGHSYDVVADIHKQEIALQMLGQRFLVHVEDEREVAAHAVAGNKHVGRQELRAAMPGIVIDIKVAVGDVVAAGQTLVVLEAMKMQNPLSAETGGKVTRLSCRKGEAVAGGALLLELA